MPRPRIAGERSTPRSASTATAHTRARFADRLRQMIKQLVQGASEQQLAEVRNSDEYRKAYDSVVDFVAKIDQRNAKNFCSETPIERR